MRLDAYLAECGLCDSRSEAKRFILAGAVMLDGVTVTKPSLDVVDGADVKVDKSTCPYVSRGGLKLAEALKRFSVDVRDRIAIDVGASSGGFTDCLLQNGAMHVFAVDSGSGQLSPQLLSDSRVTSFENYNARYMNPDDFDKAPTLAVMDVSFISATLIIPAICRVICDGADFICLIKPQFEVGRSGVGKGGIVRDEAKRRSAVSRVVDSAASCGMSCRGVIESPIKGGDGNVEYLAHFVKETSFDEKHTDCSKS